ncbi:MAG: hypothetical protein IKI78_02925 [Clostridia bacterium]|nr:hypothetical protein [Clostridia bacterium]
MPTAFIAAYIPIIVAFILLSRQNDYMRYHILEKKKGRKTKMSVEMIKDLIGQKVVINLFNESGGSQGVIIAVEDNWIKVEEKKKTRIINGDMIRDIAVIPEKNVNG